MAGVAGVALTVWLSSSTTGAQGYHLGLPDEPACQSLTPASAGGPLPNNQNLMVLRFLGVANYELTYRGQVILLDAGIELLPWWAQTGLTRDQITKADGIFIGHAHGEHLWDVPYIAERTGATVMADPIGATFLRESGLPESQISEVKGLGGDGETAAFDGFTVRPVLGHHNIIDTTYIRKIRTAAGAVTLKPGLTDPEEAFRQELGERGPRLDPETRQRLVTEGTMRYVVSLDNGFRLIYGDSAGPVTDAESELMETVPALDVALIPYYGLEMATPLTMNFVRLFKPSVIVPTHFDGHRARTLDMPIGPLALEVRKELPETTVLTPLLKAPICIDTVTKEVFVGSCLSGCFSKPPPVVYRRGAPVVSEESPGVSAAICDRRGLSGLLGGVPLAGRLCVSPVPARARLSPDHTPALAMCGVPVSGVADRRDDSPQHEDAAPGVVLGGLFDGYRQAGPLGAPAAAAVGPAAVRNGVAAVAQAAARDGERGAGALVRRRGDR